MRQIHWQSHRHTHLEEEENEVDCESNKQSKHPHVVEIPRKVVLKMRNG